MGTKRAIWNLASTSMRSIHLALILHSKHRRSDACRVSSPKNVRAYSSLTPPLPALSACSMLFLSALGSPPPPIPIMPPALFHGLFKSPIAGCPKRWIFIRFPSNAPLSGMIDWISSGFVYFMYRCMKPIIPIPINCDLYIPFNCCRSYEWTVVVMSLGSSAEPIGGGSTYLRVVRSCNTAVSGRSTNRPERMRLTLLRVDLHLHVKVDAQNDEI